MWLFYKTGFQKQMVCQLSGWIVYKWDVPLRHIPICFVSALRIDPTCVLQVFCLKRRISLIIAVVNTLYKDLAAMYSFLSCSVAHSVIPSAAGLAFSRRT